MPCHDAIDEPPKKQLGTQRKPDSICLLLSDQETTSKRAESETHMDTDTDTDRSLEVAATLVATPTPSSSSAVGAIDAHSADRKAPQSVTQSVTCPVAINHELGARDNIHVFIDTKHEDKRLYGVIHHWLNDPDGLDRAWLTWHDAKGKSLSAWAPTPGMDADFKHSIPLETLPETMRAHGLVYLGVCARPSECSESKLPAWIKQRNLTGKLTQFTHETAGTVFRDASAAAHDGPTKYYDIDGNLIRTQTLN